MARLELWWSPNAGFSGDRKAVSERRRASPKLLSPTVEDGSDGKLDCLRTVLCW